jgi:hypothetical protein
MITFLIPSCYGMSLIFPGKEPVAATGAPPRTPWLPQGLPCLTFLSHNRLTAPKLYFLNVL